MKTSAIPTLRVLAVFVAAVQLWGCKAQVIQVSPGSSLIRPAVTNVITNAPNPTNTLSLTNTASVPAATNQVAATKTFAEKLLSGEAKLSEGAAGVISLAQGGVGEEILLAYVQNHSDQFNLSPEEILYLTDLGIPEIVIASMIKHGAAQSVVGGRPSAPSTNNVAVTPPVAPNGQPTPLPLVANPVATMPAAPSYSLTATPEFEAGVQPVPGPYDVGAAPQVQYDYFYSSLAPYGSWMDVPDYGIVWQPTVAIVDTSWRPYCHRGRWIFTDCGWYWQSDYSWGWAPFHYGRWCSYPGRGWLWVPELTWGPAWVTWRYSDAYSGWAPLPPGTFYDAGFGFRYHSRHVGISFDFGLGADYYTFIPTSRFSDPFPWRHRLAGPQVVNVFQQTTIINKYAVGPNKTIINEGLDRGKIAGITRSEIRKVEVRDMPHDSLRPMKPDRLERNGSELVIYRSRLPAASPRFAGTQATAAHSKLGQLSAPAASQESRALPSVKAQVENAAQNRAEIRSVRSYDTTKPILRSSNATAQSAPDSAAPIAAGTVGQSSVKANDQTGLQTVKPANESRGLVSNEPQRIQTPIKPLLRRDALRSTANPPVVVQSRSSSSATTAVQPSRPPSNDGNLRGPGIRSTSELEAKLLEYQAASRATPPLTQPQLNDQPVVRSRGLTERSIVSPFAPPPPSSFMTPTTPGYVPQVPSGSDQPAILAPPRPQYRQELPKLPALTYPDRRGYWPSAPAQSYQSPSIYSPQPSPYVTPSRGPSDYGSSSRSAVSPSGSISVVPSGRQGPPPLQIQPSQVTPSTHSSSSSSSSANSSSSRSSSGSSGGRQQEK